MVGMFSDLDMTWSESERLRSPRMDEPLCAVQESTVHMNEQQDRMRQSDWEPVPSTSPGEQDAVALVSRVAARAILRHVVAELSVEQRAVIELTYVHGFGYKEIAAITGCPLNTVKTWMFHARRRLRALLAADTQE